MGYRAASKKAVHMIHDEAARMVDPHARGLLNGMAFSLGPALKREFEKMSDASHVRDEDV